MFEEVEQDDTFLCNICDQEVDIDDIRAHIRPCISSQEENFGEEEALQILAELGLVSSNDDCIDLDSIEDEVRMQMGLIKDDNDDDKQEDEGNKNLGFLKEKKSEEENIFGENFELTCFSLATHNNSIEEYVYELETKLRKVDALEKENGTGILKYYSQVFQSEKIKKEN